MTMNDMYTYEFDIQKKEIVSYCKLYPTDIHKSDSPWLWARNNKYDDDDVDYEKVGKWMLFLPKFRVNAVWDKIKLAVTNGELWSSKVSTTNPEESTYAIMIYTKDYTDLSDVIHVLDYLESSGIKPLQLRIFYKTDQQTYAGIYRGGGERPWIYSSTRVRQETASTTQRRRDPI